MAGGINLPGIPNITKTTYIDDSKSSLYTTYSSSKIDELIKPKIIEPYKLWGVKIDTLNSDPDTSVTFTDDCLIDGPPSNFGEKPCILKDGIVQYYLNPDDFTKKEDGTVADLSGADGDVMIEFPKLAYFIRQEDNNLIVKITNHKFPKNFDPDFSYNAYTRDQEGDLSNIYVGAYLGRVIDDKLRSISNVLPTDSKTIADFRALAQANGNGYEQMTFYISTLLQCMYLVKYRNLNSQLTLGRGYVDDNSAYMTTGNTNNKGMYFGEDTGKLQMKFAGIEDLWGNKSCWVDGYVTNSTKQILVNFTNFNDTGDGYINKGYSIGSSLTGYCDKVIGNKDCGFISRSNSGSATTYFCDIIIRSGPRIASLSGDNRSGDSSGIFCLRTTSSAGFSAVTNGARLTYRI